LGRAEQCIRKTDKLTMTWKERDGENKRVVITHKDFEVQIVFKKFKPLVQVSADAFTIKPPDDFRRYKLN
jgi:outer membrane lipoprotein-sorting protein